MRSPVRLWCRKADRRLKCFHLRSDDGVRRVKRTAPREETYLITSPLIWCSVPKSPLLCGTYCKSFATELTRGKNASVVFALRFGWKGRSKKVMDKLDWLLGEATESEVGYSIAVILGLVGMYIGIHATKPFLLWWSKYAFFRWGWTDRIIVPWLLFGLIGSAIGMLLGTLYDRHAQRPIRLLACRCRQILTLAASIAIVTWSVHGLLEARMPALFFVVPGIVFLVIGVSYIKPLTIKLRSIVAAVCAPARR